MALFKCKMCGGALEINNETVAVCEYCGTQQTLPKLDDEKKIQMYDRANHFRRNNEFDKAMGIYEQILNEDNTDAESYWSLVLCRYGIEYVEDPSSHKRIPTVNRAQFTSIYDDDNYKSALQYADSLQKTVYEEEAKTINEIQKGILEISQKEEPFDVFICYKETDANGRRTPDSVLANDLYHQLIQEGFKVFFARITLEDKLGSAYEPYIFAALNSSKVMVVLGTKPEYFNAVWVKNEWSRYLALIKNGEKKMLIPAYKDMDPYDLPEEFSHLQAQDMSKLGFMQDLIRGIKKIATTDEPKQTVVKETVVTNTTTATIEPLLKRAFMFIEDGEWDSANEYCEKVLDIDPENTEAYWGLLLANKNCSSDEDMLRKMIKEETSLDDDKLYQKAIRFAGDNKRYAELNQKIKNHFIEKFKAIVKDIEQLNNEINDLKKERTKFEPALQELAAQKEEYKNLIQESNYKLLQQLDDEYNEIARQRRDLVNEYDSLPFWNGIRKKEIVNSIKVIDKELEVCLKKKSEAKTTNNISSYKHMLEEILRKEDSVLTESGNFTIKIKQKENEIKKLSKKIDKFCGMCFNIECKICGSKSFELCDTNLVRCTSCSTEQPLPKEM